MATARRHSAHSVIVIWLYQLDNELTAVKALRSGFCEENVCSNSEFRCSVEVQHLWLLLERELEICSDAWRWDRRGYSLDLAYLLLSKRRILHRGRQRRHDLRLFLALRRLKPFCWKLFLHARWVVRDGALCVSKLFQRGTDIFHFGTKWSVGFLRKSVGLQETYFL